MELTREKALNFKVTRYEDDDKAVTEKVVKTTDVRFLINKIYDDFENRICKNCIYYNGEECVSNCLTQQIYNTEIEEYEDYYPKVSDYFGCNCFSLKQLHK